MTRRVYGAEPYRWNEMGSFGDASGMLLRQSKFPDSYDENKDILHNVDHDRLISSDYDHWGKCVKERKQIIDGSLERWFMNGKAKDILDFLINVMKADPTVGWTGFRILGTVNRSNGYPVYTLEIFAKGKNSKTKVYSGDNAPNVRRPQKPIYFPLYSFELDEDYTDNFYDVKKK